MIINNHQDLSRKEEKDRVAHQVMRGEEIMIWCGYWDEKPHDWVDGMTVSLRVKVGKKRKLVTGKLRFDSEGWDDRGDLYGYYFKPNKSRVSPDLH